MLLSLNEAKKPLQEQNNDLLDEKMKLNAEVSKINSAKSNIINDQKLLNNLIYNKNNVIYSIDPSNSFSRDNMMSVEQNCDAFKFPAAIRYHEANIPFDENGRQDTLILTHNGGFFSINTIKLEDILTYFNKFKKLPKNIVSNKLFTHYKESKNDNEDLTYLFFKGPFHDINIIEYTEQVLVIDPAKSNEQFSDYRTIHFDQLRPFIKKYFTISDNINNLVNELMNKYKLKSVDLENMCSVILRGNDKHKETNVPTHEDFIMKAKDIKKKHDENNQIPLKFIVQTDVQEFLTDFLNDPVVGPCSIYFDEVPRISKNLESTVFFSGHGSKIKNVSYYLASMIIMSRTKYLLCTSGNGEMWIVLFRNHSDNLYQYLNPKEIICGMPSLAYEGPKDNYFLN